MNKKALSPVIATVLLVSLALVLATTIFAFGTNFLKNLSPPVKCDGLSFKAEIYQNNLEIVNTGPIQIEGVQIKSINEGEVSILKKIIHTVSPGKTETIELTTIPEGTLIILPIISIGTQDNKKLSPCREQYGLEINQPF